VTLSILDGAGKTIRTIEGTKNAGLNRVYWDLRSSPSKEVRYRTSPLYAPDVPIGPDGFRVSPGGGGGGFGAGRMSILEPPGSYTVKLAVGGRDYTAPLAVRKDPHSAGTEADIAAQMKLLREIQRDLEAAGEVVNELELLRSQIYNVNRLVTDADVRKAGGELDKKLIDLEQNLVELRTTGRGQDGVRFGSKLLGKMSYLANGLAGGDFKPTHQQEEVHKLQQERLKKLQAQLDGLRGADLAAFNELLRKKGAPTIMTTRPARPSSN
jgi:hypothetical protein